MGGIENPSDRQGIAPDVFDGAGDWPTAKDDIDSENFIISGFFPLIRPFGKDLASLAPA